MNDTFLFTCSTLIGQYDFELSAKALPAQKCSESLRDATCY